MKDLTASAHDLTRPALSRRGLLRAISLAALSAPLARAFGPRAIYAQGRCMRTPGTPACNTSAVDPLFAPTGWKTVALDHLLFQVEDYQKEAAFYHALMGWTLRSDDGTQAIMDIGDWGTVIFKAAPPGASAAAPAPPTGRGRGGPIRATVESFCFVVQPWSAKSIEAELTKRGLTPTADHGAGGFESFHVKDPDGFDLQIANGNGQVRLRKASSRPVPSVVPMPFESTGWKTVWLDHVSFGVTNYKRSASFYCNLLGWTPTYDEGSQNECLIGEVGDIIIRGGNPLDPNFGRSGRVGARIDHLSFGIEPWDTDAVKAALESRGLRAQVDTSTGDEIHVAAFKSYHTSTPNGYNLQISAVSHQTRLTLSTAVKPKTGGGNNPRS